jgi:hypothetical protein
MKINARNVKFAWKYRRALWKYRTLIRHRREIAGAFAVAAGVAIVLLRGADFSLRRASARPAHS